MGLFSMFGGGGDQAGAAMDAAKLMADYAKQAGSANQTYLQQGLNLNSLLYNMSRNDVNKNYATANSTLQPYNAAGYGALDAYLGTLGLGVPEGGSLNFAKTLENQQRNQYAQDQLKNVIPQLHNLAIEASNVVGTTDGFDGTPETAMKMIADIFNKVQSGQIPKSKQTDEFVHNAGRYLNQTQEYYGNLKKEIDRTQLTPEQQAQAEAYNKGTLNTNAESSNSALAKFFDNPIYQLQFGNAASATDPNASPLQRFQESPGYQFQLNEGQKALERSMASRGLLESGAFAKELNTFGQGVANQEWNNYLNRVTGTFQNYQNSLAQMAGMGNQTSSNLATLSSNQGTTLAGLNTNYGNLGMEANAAMGSNAANSLLAQGNAYAGGMMNAANINAANSQAGGMLGSYGLGQLGSFLNNKNGGAGTSLGGFNLGGAASGASQGMAFGPYGAIAGGILGGLF